MSKYNFNKHEKWDCNYFYKIYYKNNEKYIMFDNLFNREDGEHMYMDWVIYDYHDCEMPLIKFLEFDYLYQMDSLFKEKGYDRYIVDPKVAFEEVNKILSSNIDQPYEKLLLCDINPYTQCGNYFGL